MLQHKVGRRHPAPIKRDRGQNRPRRRVGLPFAGSMDAGQWLAFADRLADGDHIAQPDGGIDRVGFHVPPATQRHHGQAQRLSVNRSNGAGV